MPDASPPRAAPLGPYAGRRTPPSPSDGPIDLILEAWGRPDAVREAYRAATTCMATLLDTLCDELPALRAAQPGPVLHGPVARRMQRAVAPHARNGFITPMAAVAGAVAEHVLAAMTDTAALERAYVNNGGDIALHLSPGTEFSVGIVGRIAPPRLAGHVTLHAGDGISGVATSGWPGRSHSLGIADAVTVLAASASAADAAATMIANAVDLPGHKAVDRAPANSLAPDSDLGDRLVTRHVAPLPRADIDTALAKGAATAEALRTECLIVAAFLHLQGESRVVAPPGLLPT